MRGSGEDGLAVVLVDVNARRVCIVNERTDSIPRDTLQLDLLFIGLLHQVSREHGSKVLGTGGQDDAMSVKGHAVRCGQRDVHEEVARSQVVQAGEHGCRVRGTDERRGVVAA